MGSTLPVWSLSRKEFLHWEKFSLENLWKISNKNTMKRFCHCGEHLASMAFESKRVSALGKVFSGKPLENFKQKYHEEVLSLWGAPCQYGL